MRLRTIILVVLALFCWVFYKSGALVRKETVIQSDVPGAPDKGSVQYTLDWGKFSGYLSSFRPR